jgi:putative adenylate-forming enzyme
VLPVIRAIFDYIFLKKHQNHFTKKDIKTYQLKALKKIVFYAKSHSPFYQETLKDFKINSLDDFHQLPKINKKVMMENFSFLNTCGLNIDDIMSYALEKEKNKDYLGYYQNKYVIGLSSGTSGNKGIYITPKSMTKRLPGVFLARSGLSLKDLPMKILFCLRVFSQGFNDINAPLIKLNYMSTMTPVEEIIHAIHQNQINILMAPPSLIRLLLPYQDKILVSLKKIITYAEVLEKEDKLQFEKAFKTKVIEIYQASEGQIASACRLGNLHINEDLVYIEIYDENQQLIFAPNIVGHKMVLTNLINFAQPLIRYEMNDMIILDEPCPCGSHFRTIKKILGRHDDLIYFLNSKNEQKIVFPDLFSRWIITESDHIREFQVIQHEIGKLDLYIDSSNTDFFESLADKIKNELNHLGLTVDLNIIQKKLELPKDLNKYKRFISNIKKQ